MPVERKGRGKPAVDEPLPLPDVQALTAGLTAVLGKGAAAGPVTILARSPNDYESAYSSEIVTCRLPDGSKRQLLCKYGAGIDHSAHGHRGGVAYEAKVYRRVLQPLKTSTPKFYGAHRDGPAGTWLVLEYVDQSARVSLAEEPDAMARAVRWIGRFHAASAARLALAPFPFLKTYDEAYYLGWVQRTSQFAGRWQRRFPWFATLCKRFERFAAPLWRCPATVIHGEYYPRNVLIRSGTIFPVDWESAAIGAGEIDLATLTEEWPAATVRLCEREYQQTRWGGHAPRDFWQRLAAARLYLLFRWMGEHPRWATRKSTALWCFEQLRSAGRRLGLIENGRDCRGADRRRVS